MKQLREVWRSCTRRRVEMKQLREVWRSCARRVEMKQLREVWRSRTRNNVEADDGYFVLNPAADW